MASDATAPTSCEITHRETTLNGRRAFFREATSAGEPQGSLILGYNAHGRALSGNTGTQCANGVNYNYQTFVQSVP